MTICDTIESRGNISNHLYIFQIEKRPERLKLAGPKMRVGRGWLVGVSALCWQVIAVTAQSNYDLQIKSDNYTVDSETTLVDGKVVELGKFRLFFNFTL